MRASFLLLATLSVSCASTTQRLKLPPLQVVEKVVLQRYLGTWYEIASCPQRFQTGCSGTQATYSLRPDGDLKVLNRCHLDTLAGEEKVATGRARVVDATSNAKLEVSFFGPFWGDYWVIQLDPEYRYAVVGSPGRDYLWILSRTPALDGETWKAIVDRLKTEGYPLDRLQRTLQN